MGRRKQRTRDDEKISSNGLETAWPSSPTKPPRFVLNCYNHESERLYVVNSFACYAIRKIFDALVGENEIEPSPLSETTVTFDDIDIKSDQLQQILDYQYSKEEESWELPSPYPEDVQRFLTGPRMSTGLQRDETTGVVAPKPAKVKVDRDKFTSIQDICDDIKMEAREARGILRKSKMEKPAGGWLFDDAKAKEIKAMLIKERK